MFPVAFGFFAGYTPPGVQMMTDIDKYLSFVLTMFIAFGITFETPVVVVVLVRMGVVPLEKLKGFAPYVIVGAFVVGAMFTPPDVISQLHARGAAVAAVRAGPLHRALRLGAGQGRRAGRRQGRVAGGLTGGRRALVGNRRSHCGAWCLGAAGRALRAPGGRLGSRTSACGRRVRDGHTRPTVERARAGRRRLRRRPRPGRGPQRPVTRARKKPSLRTPSPAPVRVETDARIARARAMRAAGRALRAPDGRRRSA